MPQREALGLHFVLREYKLHKYHEKIGCFVLNLTAVKFKIFFGNNQVNFCKKNSPI